MSWKPLDCREVARLLDSVPFPWWISGGWAIDLFLGRETRRHADVEVGVLRRDQCALYEKLADFEIHAARSGTLTELTPEVRREGCALVDHGFWCRPRGTKSWTLELLLEESDGEDWLFRRDARIRRPLRSVVSRTTDGVPFVIPEIQLLFKAKEPRPRDDLDFENARPALSPHQRDWLAEALRLVHPGHAWLDQLV